MTMDEAGGFLIDEVEMSDFMRYVGKKTPISFPSGFTVITGKTGAGKSTILDAVTFALYGSTTRTDPPSNIKTSELFQPGGHVRVSFKQAGHYYEVRRGFTSRGGSFLELDEDGKSLGGTIPEKDKMIVNIVGLDYDGFRNSTFVRQEEMKELGSERGSDRLRIFQKLFRLETFEKAQDAARAEHVEVESQIKEREGEIEIRRERVAKMPEMQEELKEAEEVLSKDRKAAMKLKESLDKAQKELKGKEKVHQEYLKVAAKTDELEKRLITVKKRLDNTKEEAEKSEKLRKKVETLEKELKDYEKLRKEGETLKDAQKDYALLKKDVETTIKRKRDAEAEHDRRLKSITSRYFDVEKRIAKLKTDVSREEAFELLRTEGALGERIERIKKEVEWLSGKKKIISSLEDERSKAKEELDEVKDRVGKINEDSFVLSELKRQIEQGKEEIKREDGSFKPRLEQLEADVQKAMEALKKVKFSEVEEKRLNEIRDKVSKLRSKAEELDEARAKLKAVGDVAKLIEELQEQRSSTESELKEMKKSVVELKDAEDAYAKAKKVVDDLRSQVEDGAKRLGAQEEACKRLAKQVEELKGEEKKIKEIEGALKQLHEKREILAILKDEVFHKRGVVMYAINQLLPTLQIETSKNLADLTDGRFSKVKLDTYEESGRHGVRINVEGVDGQWHDIGEFSGGERTQINAALRFAIAKELASMPQIGRTYSKMKTLFIDEGDLGSLDTEVSRDLFVQKLFRMGDFFDKVILITHLTEIAEKFQSRMHITMNDRGESRVEVVA